VAQHDDGRRGALADAGRRTCKYTQIDTITTSYRVFAVADLDRDGTPDLLWYSTTGQLVAWMMKNGGRVRDVAFGP
jgi:hypothetical protein